MTMGRRSNVARLCWLVPGLLLVLAMMAPRASGQSEGIASASTVSLSDLERLVQQLEDPQQREQLLKTLHALIVVARQDQPTPTPEDQPSRFWNQPKGIFFAFGTLSERLSTMSRTLGQGLVGLPSTLKNQVARLSEPTALRLLLHISLNVAILVVLGFILQLIADRIEARLRDHLLSATTLPPGRKIWWALLTVVIAVAPSFLLLLASGIVLSVFPIGAILSGLVALGIVTLLLVRLAHAIGRVLFGPHEPSIRLLPLDDRWAQFVWTWFLRLLTLAAAWYLITRTLLTIGLAEDLYRLIRGTTLLPFPILLTGLVLRLARTYRGPPGGESAEARREAWSSPTLVLWKIGPIIAIAYIWVTALFAIAGFQHWVPYMAVASLETAAVVIGMLLVLRALAFLFTKACALNERGGQYLSGLEVRTLRYVQAVWRGTHVTIILIGIAIIFQIWGVTISWFFTSPVGSDILSRAIALVVTLAIVALIVDLSTFAGQQLIEPGPENREISKKRRTLVPLVCTVVKYGAMISGGLIVLYEVGINITPILAGVGIVSLAIGFGAQTLVKDIINGLFILFEDSVAVGDVAVIKGMGGLVEAVNLRTIRLRDVQGNVHVIPNSQVEMITNMTKGFSYYVLDVGVAYREDTDAVGGVLQEIDAGLREDPAFAPDMLAPIEIMGVDRFADSAVIMKARLRTRPGRQWAVGREFNRRLKKTFDERGIEIPFRH